MPDFGIFRGFNEKLFGDKLYAGQLPTQLGVIGSESTFDIDALAFFARVTTAGGTLSATEQLAINTLVVQMKEDGIWTKMKAIYPMVGASSAACAQNLKSSSFTATFTNGWSFASDGITPNNSYMNTFLICSNELISNSSHFSQYFQQSTAGANSSFDWGAQNSSGAFAGSYNFNGNLYMRIETSANQFVQSVDNSAGFRLISRTASNITKLYVNNTNTYTSNTSSTGYPNIELYIGQFNSNGSPLGSSARKFSFASIGDGLSDAEASDFYDSIQTFQTTLSRNV